MQNTSAQYKSITGIDGHYFEAKIVIGGVTYDETKIISVSTSLAMFSRTLEIGKAVAAQIDVKILNPTGTIPTMAKMQLYVRAKGLSAVSGAVTVNGEKISSTYFSYSSNKITVAAGANATVSSETLSFPVTSTAPATSEWLPQGVFFIDTREITQNQDGLDVLTLHGFDAMLKAEQEYPSSAVAGDDYDTAYVRAIASKMGVSVDSRTWEVMGTGTIIPFPLGYSMREILGYIAAAYVGCFIMTDDGKLRLISMAALPAETNLLIDSLGDVITFGGDAILV